MLSKFEYKGIVAELEEELKSAQERAASAEKELTEIGDKDCDAFRARLSDYRFWEGYTRAMHQALGNVRRLSHE